MEIPDLPDEYSVRLLGIDPGTTTLGVTIADINLKDWTFTVRYVTTYNVTLSTGDAEDALALGVSNRALRLKKLRESILELLTTTGVDYVFCETYFLRRGKVSAFEALVECYGMIRDVVWDYDSTTPFKGIDPVSVKNAVGVSHRKTTKDDMTRGINRLKGKDILGEFDVRALDEHSIDSIAVSYAGFRTHFLKQDVRIYLPKIKKKRRTKKVRRVATRKK